MGHAKLSPSSSERWSTCLASVALTERLKAEGKIPEETSSSYAEEGTKAHAVAEEWLLVGEPPKCDDSEMVEHVRGFVGMVEDIGGHTETEVRVPLFYSRDEKGTVDALTLSPDERTLYVDDLKYGQGVSVEAEGNTQLAIYAMSALLSSPSVYGRVKEVVMRIWQPRIIGERPMRVWSLTRKELGDFCMRLGQQADRIARGGDLPFAPSDKACQFCDVKAFCSARASRLFGELDEVAPVLTTEGSPASLVQLLEFPRAADLSPEQLGKLQWLAKPMKKFLDEVEALNRESPPPGWTQAPGRDSRVWADEAAAETYLKGKIGAEAAYEKKLLTVAKAEKAVGKLSGRSKAHFDKLVERKEGKPVLVPEEDVKKLMDKEFGDA